jgi:hypothetical protein
VLVPTLADEFVGVDEVAFAVAEGDISVDSTGAAAFDEEFDSAFERACSRRFDSRRQGAQQCMESLEYVSSLFSGLLLQAPVSRNAREAALQATFPVESFRPEKQQILTILSLNWP